MKISLPLALFILVAFLFSACELPQPIGETLKVADNGVSINPGAKSLTISFTKPLATWKNAKKDDIKILHEGQALASEKIISVAVVNGKLLIKLDPSINIAPKDTFKVEIPEGAVEDTEGNSNDKLSPPEIKTATIFVQSITVNKTPGREIKLTFASDISAHKAASIKLYQGQSLLASGKYSVGAIDPAAKDKIGFTITDSGTALSGVYRFVFEAGALTLTDKSTNEPFEYSSPNLTGPTLASTNAIVLDGATKKITINLAAAITSKTDANIKVYKKAGAAASYTTALTAGTGNDYTIDAFDPTKNQQVVISLLAAALTSQDFYKVVFETGALTANNVQNNEFETADVEVVLPPTAVTVASITVSKTPNKEIRLTFNKNLSAHKAASIKLYQGQSLLASGKYSVGAIDPAAKDKIGFTITDSGTALSGVYRFVFEAGALTLTDKSTNEPFEYSSPNLTGPTLASTNAIVLDGATKKITINLAAAITSKTDANIKVYKKAGAAASYPVLPLTEGTGNDYTIDAFDSTKNQQVVISLLTAALTSQDFYKVVFETRALIANNVQNNEFNAEVQVIPTPDAPTELTIMAENGKELKFEKTSDNIASLSAKSVQGTRVEFLNGTTSLGVATADAYGLATLTLTGSDILSAEATYDLKARASVGSKTSPDSTVKTIEIDKTNFFVVSNDFTDGRKIGAEFGINTNNFPSLAWSGNHSSEGNLTDGSYVIIIDDESASDFVHANLYVPLTITSIDKLTANRPGAAINFPRGIKRGSTDWGWRAPGWGGHNPPRHTYNVQVFLVSENVTTLSGKQKNVAINRKTFSTKYRDIILRKSSVISYVSP